MWQRWGLVWGFVGLIVGAFIYGGVWSLRDVARSQNSTDSTQVAEKLADLRVVEKQTAELKAQAENASTKELDQDVLNLKSSLSALSERLTKACEPTTGAVPATLPKTARKDVPMVNERWYDVQRAGWPLEQQYDAMERRYAANFSSSSPGSAVGAEPIAMLARATLDDFLESLSRVVRPWPGGGPNPSDSCETLKTHRLVANVDASPLLAPFTRAKQRIETQAASNKTKVDELEKRKVLLTDELKKLQDQLAESPKLIVVKYLPISMAIILAFGGLMFVAARVVPESVIGQLVHSGQLIQFPTVVILFAVILVLSLAEGLTKDHTATLLAAVAGYILGSTRNGRTDPAGGGGGGGTSSGDQAGGSKNANTPSAGAG